MIPKVTQEKFIANPFSNDPGSRLYKTGDLARLRAGKAQYSVLLNPDGGIIDDIIFYYQSESQGVLIVNASTTDKDREWILGNLEGSGVKLKDLSRERVLIALQGPKAATILQPLVGEKLSDFGLFNHWESQLFGEKVFIARTGYTGEDGFEIMAAPEIGQRLWTEFLNLGVTPCSNLVSPNTFIFSHFLRLIRIIQIWVN